MALIAGLDLSLTSTGLACPDGTLITVRSKSTSYDLSERKKRLDGIYTKIMQAITSEGALDMLVIEGPSMAQQHTGSLTDRYGLWWRIVGAALAAGIDVVELPPTTLKKFATGSGAANKVSMALALSNRAGLSISDDNQVDAAWLRYAGHQIIGKPLLELPIIQQAALAKWAHQ